MTSIELQKCTAIFFLKCGVVFYKRELWTHNLTIYETRGTTSSAICFLGNETVAGCGKREVIS
jgi:hypothetical protein